MKKSFWVYILASKKNGTLYIGCTGHIERRIYEHKNKLNPGFTSRYNVTRFVYAEEYYTAYEAIRREKQMKKWKREWKLRLINEANPEWHDLYDYIL